MEELQRVGPAEEAGGARKDIDQVVAATEAAGMSQRVAARRECTHRPGTASSNPAARA